MSDPIPRGYSTNEDETPANDGETSSQLPPEGLPDELILKRLERLDTRRALADLCKNVPGLDEVLLPPGIRADALTRKTGNPKILQGICRRVINDPAAWKAFRTAIHEQIPSETREAVEGTGADGLEGLVESHTIEGLLYAAMSTEQEVDPQVVQRLVERWNEDHSKAKKKASRDAQLSEMEGELDQLRRENERLTFAARAADERAESLRQGLEELQGERDGILSKSRRADEQSAAAQELRGQLREKLSELEGEVEHLNRTLRSERKQYSSAAKRLDEMHEELTRAVNERDSVRNALERARFTDNGFGNLLIRAVKNEVRALPDSLDNSAYTARLLEFMSSVLQAHSELTAGREKSPSQNVDERQEAEDDPESSLVNPGVSSSPPGQPADRGKATGARDGLTDLADRDLAEERRRSSGGAERGGAQNGSAPGTPSGNRNVASKIEVKPRPTVSFQALGGAGEVGGSSHFMDLGSTRVLVDAGIKPDGRGSAAPEFSRLGKLDAAIITHAHLDHCGALPTLCQQRPDLPIYCTPPSAKLIISALNDHAAMGGSLSGGASIRQVQSQLKPVGFGEPVRVGKSSVTLTESGHILGAASVLIQSGEATAFHTGDICMEDHFSIPSAKLPEVSNIDLLIMEATLADRQHQPFAESIKTMVNVINEATERGGTVLIPTYALGQAQEIILGLKHHSKEYGLDREAFIYVDGSVVTTSERLYAEQIGYLKPYLHLSDPKEIFSSENIRAVPNDDKARERILTNPCAIIASPVTMQGGASAFYRRRLQNDPKNAVILPSNAESSYGAFKASGESAEWQVERVSFAAHCTQDELMKITETLSPRQVILVHGSKRRINNLAHRLAPSYKIHTPAIGETIRTIL